VKELLQPFAFAIVTDSNCFVVLEATNVDAVKPESIIFANVGAPVAARFCDIVDVKLNVFPENDSADVLPLLFKFVIIVFSNNPAVEELTSEDDKLLFVIFAKVTLDTVSIGCGVDSVMLPGAVVTMTSCAVPVIVLAIGASPVDPINSCPLVKLVEITLLLESVSSIPYGARYGKAKLLSTVKYDVD